MKINKLVLAIIIFIIILILVFLFVMPKYKKLSELQDTLAKKQLEYDNKSIYYAKIAEIIKSIETKKDALGKIDSALPSDFYLSSLIYFFQRKGAESGLAIKSVTLSKVSAPVAAAAADTDIQDITFNIRLSGTYEGFKNFIAALDKSARLFEVNSITFSNSGAGKDPKLSALGQTYEFNMEVLTHIY